MNYFMKKYRVTKISLVCPRRDKMLWSVCRGGSKFAFKPRDGYVVEQQKKGFFAPISFV